MSTLSQTQRLQKLPEPESTEVQGTVTDKVAACLVSYPHTRQHDDLLCVYYHLLYDDWQYRTETPNHLILRIPDEAVDSATSASSILRSRREIQDRLPEPEHPLEDQIDTHWHQREWQQHLIKRESKIASEWYGQGGYPLLGERETKDQVAWLLSNHPETRDSDNRLIWRWRRLFAGWLNRGDRSVYSVPKGWLWQETTPASITRTRRRLQEKGLFTASETVQQARKDKEEAVRQAYRAGNSPDWGEL